MFWFFFQRSLTARRTPVAGGRKNAVQPMCFLFNFFFLSFYICHISCTGVNVFGVESKRTIKRTTSDPSQMLDIISAPVRHSLGIKRTLRCRERLIKRARECPSEITCDNNNNNVTFPVFNMNPFYAPLRGDREVRTKNTYDNNK